VPPEPNSTIPPRRARLVEVGRVFLKLGLTAFGGPAAHIALMEDEAVRRHGWVTREEFLDLLAAANLIPGPNSTELAIHLGYRRAGWPGLLLAGAAFILPAFLIVLGIAWAYTKYGQLPQAHGILYGVKPVVLAIIVQALWRLGCSAVKTRLLAALALIGAVLTFAGANELIVLFGLGLAAVLWRAARKPPPTSLFAIAPALLSTPVATATASAAPLTLGSLFLFFAKTGSLLFGSGYVLLAFLRADLVQRWGWLTEAQLLDAIAVGQFTPGPIFTSATFIGYVLSGTAGAVVATIGIFLPAFFFVAISGPLIPKLRQSSMAGAFLDGVNVASLALMLGVTWHLSRAAMVDWVTLGLALVSAFFVFRLRTSSAWLVLGGAAAGLLFAPHH
jgi:chromate transporter